MLRSHFPRPQLGISSLKSPPSHTTESSDALGESTAQDFGFAHDYIHETTGAHVGIGAVQPLAAFIPVNGSYSKGPQDIAFSPAAFPAGLNHGVFIGFYGNSGSFGVGNPQNPLVFYDLSTGRYFDFISNAEPNIDHPVGLVSTPDSLFVADLSPTDQFSTLNPDGIIYQIQTLPHIYSIQGHVYAVNAAKKSGLPNQTVFIDANDNGVLDTGERTAVTDSKGNYKFVVPVGNYRVREVVPTGYNQTGTTFYDVVFKKRRAAKLDFSNVPITA
jgi:hypothetical protein